MTEAVMPGTRWVSRRGKHTGNEVEIVGFTAGDRVKVRRVGGEGASWNKGKSEAAGVQTLGRDVFVANYAPKASLAAGAGQGGSFRRNGAAAKAATAIAEEYVSDKVVQITQARDRVSGTGLNAEVMSVTPDQARAWLDRGGPNRKLSERRVAKYTAAMLRGEWQLTGEAIILDGQSRVRNGQHRLEAIVRAGIAIQTLVVRNVADEAFDVMDTGGTRSAGDVFGMHGYSQRFATASAARTLLLIERFGRPYASSYRDTTASPSNKEQLDYAEAHPEIRDGITLATAIHAHGFIGGTGLWAATLTLLVRVDAAKAQEFVDRLIEGDNLARDSAILKLRNLFRGNYTTWDNSSKGREQLMALVIKGWNLWRRGEGVQLLRWRSEGRGAEDFPVPE